MDIEQARLSAKVAQQTIAEWRRDENGRVTIHPDVISKAVDAIIFNLGGPAKGD